MTLDDRKRSILRAIVHTYVKSAEPVASDQISSIAGLGVRSATIRNEMAAMSEMGYLTQPHTSAGRIPSDLGYRFYVDHLMPRAPVGPRYVEQVDEISHRAGSVLDDVLAGACRLLSAMTHMAAIATAPSSDNVTLKHVELTRASHDKLLLITLWSNGQFRHVLINSGEVSAADLERANSLISKRLTGVHVEQCRSREIPEDISASQRALQLAYLARDLTGEVARGVNVPEVFVDGASFLAGQPEFSYQPTIEKLLAVLEQHSALASLLEAAAVGSTPQAVIGGENPLEPLRSCSLIAASYYGGPGVRGAVGVCGPTRMDYSRNVAAVQLLARTLSATLEGLLPA